MNHDELLDVLGIAHRVVIIGGPGTGKSTLAHRIGDRAVAAWPVKADPLPLVIRSTDELVGVLEWSEASAEVARWLDEPGPWIIEGVATARALRKWLVAHPGEPLDAVIVLTGAPFVELTKGQAAMNKGVSTVWNEIAIEVFRRGTRVINAASPKPVRETPESPQPATAQ